MNNRVRFVPPLAAVLLLGAALALRFFWPGPAEGPPVKDVSHVVAAPTPAPVPVPPVSAPVKAEPVKAEVAKAEPHVEMMEGGRATVVPIGPGDVVPEPEVANPPPQQNDPIEPEKPQTAAWRHGKLVRITELLGRDLERLEKERKDAESRGDAAEAKRLEVQLARHRERLGRLREETAELAEAALQEERGAVSTARSP
ncbi:hypothetical protein [Vitiosangium sp. GDMCC 1.1324]|uniref:hypothetical protein n=1 Tax=Vitiosangium sp. (strain GDMCC 1.1324) TaxID=2138576 RepID=UPI000D38B772|nr:hypothetical protein [Vitiosangium sp. GDMCC 1.1324]PTL83327.1 hypothetical protein DAT35_15195 [Vitiosangium sp. GDMCC 1.1324]